GTQQIAFVSEGEGHFSPRKLKLGVAGDDDKVQVLQGLSAGETVVTSGQFLMDVESRTIEATQKLSAPTMSSASAEQMPQTSETMPATQPANQVAAATTAMSMTTGDGKEPAATQPALKGELVSAYCPMAKANWLQFGDVIANPYMGAEMPTCGTVQRRIPITATDPAFAVIIQSYLDVGKALNSDRLDSAALHSLQ